MAPTLRTMKDIPSITALYRSMDLSPAAGTKQLVPSANQEFNDKVCTIQGDITVLEVDAIVNAANAALGGGGGVDGAIHRAAGPELMKECRSLGGCFTGSAKITDAYNLPCKKVIHAVGPVFKNYERDEPVLRSCYSTALSLAVEYQLKTIAFPAISTGVYGYPSTGAAHAALAAVHTFLSGPDGSALDKIIFCNFLDRDVDAYAKHIPTFFPPTEEDLNPPGEYCAETTAQKDDVPTNNAQTLPKPTDAGVTDGTATDKIDPRILQA